MNILWLSWKDNSHPLAGGAELVSGELQKRLVKDGHNVRLITAGPNNLSGKEFIDGVEIYRIGNRYSVYIKARKMYRRFMKGWADIIIDEMNTIPFFGFQYEKNVPTILLTYQLAREVWFYQLLFPFSLVGYLVEPIYLRYISKRYLMILTESKSTKQDLVKYGFKPEKVKLFRIGMRIKPLEKLVKNTNYNSIIYLGSVRPMKQTDHVIKAFEIAKDINKELVLNVVGDYNSTFGEKVYNYSTKSRHAKSIHFIGKVTDAVKQELLDNASVIIITSVKEGWGIIATEAASRGVPAIAYASDGLRDSVINGKTGILVPPGDFQELAKKIVSTLDNTEKLEMMRRSGLEHSRQFTFENSYTDFWENINNQLAKK